MAFDESLGKCPKHAPNEAHELLRRGAATSKKKATASYYRCILCLFVRCGECACVAAGAALSPSRSLYAALEGKVRAPGEGEEANRKRNPHRGGHRHACV